MDGGRGRDVHQQCGLERGVRHLLYWPAQLRERPDGHIEDVGEEMASGGLGDALGIEIWD